MKHFVQKIILLVIFFISMATQVFASESIKINELVFDNSDSIIFIKTKGKIDDSVTITKGYLKEPDRVFLDINNSILTTPKKNYDGKYSIFNNIKISQFSLEPNVVRLVFEYNSNFDISDFKVYKNVNGIYIKTTKKLVKISRFKTAYSNAKLEDRIPFFKGSRQEEVISKETNETEKKEETIEAPAPVLKTSSKYYIDSITKTKNGFLITGYGKLSLIPSFMLQEPDRLIMDLDDTILNPELRNRAFSFDADPSKENSTPETLRLGQNSQSITRLVIQGENAKQYRGIISPDSKSLYIANKTNILQSKMADNNATLTRTAYSKIKDLEIISLKFDDSVTFDVFEENQNLYLDINNINEQQEGVYEPIAKAIPDMKIVRIALDKVRIILPQNKTSGEKYISVRTSPDNDEIRILAKLLQKRKSTGTFDDSEISIVPKSEGKKRTSEISNLFSVVIDAGHGGTDVGATRSEIYEKDITLQIAKMVEKNLNKKNVRTFMVRDKDKTVSLTERCEFANEKKADLFVSVHVNSSLNEEIYGVETHWFKEDSYQYANSVHNELAKKVKSWKTMDRGLFKSQFYVINHTDAPAILCEIGFISNQNERLEIVKTKRQEEIAEAIADGIYNYLKARK